MGNKVGLKEIIEKFQFEGEYVSEKSHKVGNINDTNIVTYKLENRDERYIIQRINHNVFTKPDKLMENMVKVTKHIEGKVKENGGDIKRECLRLIKTKEGAHYYKTECGEYYRAFHFINNATTYMKVEEAKHMYETGKALGRFQSYLSDFEAEELFEVIEDFHHTPKRFETFLEAVKKDTANRVEKAKDEIDFIMERKNELSKLVNLCEEGKIPVRVTHNDTKFNNVMIDNRTGNAVCVIDLDTVMPGLSLYDFGDAIRSGCSTAEEDEVDLDKVTVDMELYENFVKGVMEECGADLTEAEIENIPFSAKLITIELAMRFLTDYLNGDKYFKVDREHHNLERTRNQLKLAREMELKFKEVN